MKILAKCLFVFFGIFLTYLSCAVEIYGHRGAAGLAPENTLESVRTALDLGVDYIDLDIGITKDNIIVAYHDMRLNPHITRTQQGEWLLEEGEALKHLSYDALLKYDVGQINPSSEYAKQFPHQLNIHGTKIPTLQEVIQYVKQRNSNTKFQIEIKSNPFDLEHSPDPNLIVPTLIKVLQQEGVESMVEVHSFDWRNLRLLQILAPKIKRSYITEESLFHREVGTTWMAGYRITEELNSFPKLIKAIEGHVWCPYYKDLTEEAIHEAHALGLKVTTWSVDDPEAMVRLMGWGVDGIITNRPDILIGLMVARQMNVPQTLGI